MSSRKITLTSPRYRIVIGDPDNPESWQEVEVQAMTRDLAAGEALFVSRRWSKPSDQPIKFTAVAAYMALLRTGQISGTWEEFERSYIEVNDADSVEVGPTEPGADLG